MIPAILHRTCFFISLYFPISQPSENPSLSLHMNVTSLKRLSLIPYCQIAFLPCSHPSFSDTVHSVLLSLFMCLNKMISLTVSFLSSILECKVPILCRILWVSQMPSEYLSDCMICNNRKNKQYNSRIKIEKLAIELNGTSTPLESISL